MTPELAGGSLVKDFILFHHFYSNIIYEFTKLVIKNAHRCYLEPAGELYLAVLMYAQTLNYHSFHYHASYLMASIVSRSLLKKLHTSIDLFLGPNSSMSSSVYLI